MADLTLLHFLFSTFFRIRLVYYVNYFPLRWHASVRAHSHLYESERDVNKKILFVLWYIHTEHMQKSDIYIKTAFVQYEWTS